LRDLLHQDGFFWLFSLINLFSLVFILVFIKESRGLTDVQKKALYSEPGSVSVEIDKTEDLKEADREAKESLLRSIHSTKSKNHGEALAAIWACLYFL